MSSRKPAALALALGLALGAGSAGAQEQRLPIGVLIPLTGGGAAEAPFLRDAVELAFDEIHAMLEAGRHPIRFDPIIEDTRTSPEGGLEAIESVAAAGARIVIGPWSSAAASGARAYADANEILIISPSSTSPALAIPDDYLYRLITPDTLQGAAVAQYLEMEGVEQLVVVHRGDSYGAGLAEALEEAYGARGGTLVRMAYDPDLTDYASEVEEVAREVRRLGADDTAVMLIAFQPDGLNILGHARLNPTLSQTRWFGSKDTLSPVFFPPTAPEEIGAFMAEVELSGFFPTPPTNPIRIRFEADFEERFGRAPSPWALYMYDAAWIAALSVLATGEYDGRLAREVVGDVAARYIGASGHKLLNEDGDSAVGVYDLMVARAIDGTYRPETIGVWDSGTGELRFTK